MATYLKPGYFDKLYQRLCSLIYKQEDASTIAGQAGLNMAAISFSTIALNTWDSVISQAEVEEKVLELISVAGIFLNGDEALDTLKKDIESGVAIEKGISISKMRPAVVRKDICELLLIRHKADVERCSKLKKFFSALEYAQVVVVKDIQTDMPLGEIHKQREMMFLKAQIIMPVISPDFFDPAEDFMRFVRASVETDKSLVPLLLVKCPYARIQVLKEYQALPASGKFINEYSNEELGFNEVVERIVPLIDECNRIYEPS